MSPSSGVRAAGAEAADDRVEARRLGRLEPLVGEIGLVDDLAEPGERRVVEPVLDEKRLLVLVTGARLGGRSAVAVLAVAITVLAVGECLYDSVQGPLVAGLAPDGSVGRYLAVSSFGWQLGFIVAGAVGALGLERALPEAVRVTP